MNVTTLGELKKFLGQAIEREDVDYPKTITFNRGIELPKYRITIELVEEDYFIDSKGVKWKKVIEEESPYLTHK